MFVHDVGSDGQPTLAARGSHRTVAYYSYIESISLTRFADGFVRRHYEPVALTGPAGGGFLLDTNGLHRAMLGEGGRPRTTRLPVASAASSRFS